MNINTLTIKAQEALQAALTLARERGQQAVEPLHILAALLREDDSLAAFLLGRMGVDVRTLRSDVERAVGSLPRVEGAGEQYFAPDASRTVQRAVDFTKKFNDRYASVEHLLLALVAERGQASDLLKRSRDDRARARRGDPHLPQGVDGRFADRLAGVRCAGQICREPQRTGPLGQARSGDRPRRGDPPRAADPLAPHEEQSDPRGRSRRRQDGHRRGHRPPDHRRRRAREPEDRRSSIRSTWAP